MEIRIRRMGRRKYYEKLHKMGVNCEVSVCGVVRFAGLDIVRESHLVLCPWILWVGAFQQQLVSKHATSNSSDL